MTIYATFYRTIKISFRIVSYRIVRQQVGWVLTGGAGVEPVLHGADALRVGHEAGASPSAAAASSPGRGGAAVPWRPATSRRPPVDCRTGRAGRGPAAVAAGAPVGRRAGFATDED